MIDLNYYETMYFWGTQALVFFAGMMAGMAIVYYRFYKELKDEKQKEKAKIKKEKIK